MAASSYEAALARLLAHEGGYTNHPNDPGGPTNHGITIADYRRYVRPDAGASDIRAMPLDAAKAIYRAKYWDALACDALPPGLDYCVFDYGVNSGISRAAKVLQRSVGVADDGRIGPATLAAVASRDASDLVETMCDERLAFLRSLRTWAVFGRGWGRRVAEVKAVALAMARADAQMKAGA
jgi:lysozyme family protein